MTQRVGPYHLERRIGEGGQSVVWAATDVRTGQSVAFKLLRPGLATASDVARLRREGAVLGSLQDPGLPRGFEVYEDVPSSTIGLAMERVEGVTLADASKAGLPPGHVFQIGAELARVLGVLHARGIVHRDIKPANVILRPGWETDATGRVVLVDFGIARGTESQNTTHTAAGGTVGTLAFIAPEALLGDGARVAAPTLDTYATGVVLWMLLTGQHPTGLSATSPLIKLVAAHANPTRPVVDPARAQDVERVVPGLLSIAEGCLHPDPRQRIPDGAALGQALARVQQLAATTSLPLHSPQPAAQWTQLGHTGAPYTHLPPATGWTAYQAPPGPPPQQSVDASRSLPTQLVQRSQAGSQGTALPWPAIGGLVLLGVSLLGATVVAVFGLLLMAARPSGSASTDSGVCAKSYYHGQTRAILVPGGRTTVRSSSGVDLGAADGGSQVELTGPPISLNRQGCWWPATIAGYGSGYVEHTRLTDMRLVS